MKRSAFLLTSSAVAVAGASAHTAGVPGGTQLVERGADFDEEGFRRSVGRAARIRQVVESVSFNPATLNNVKNTLNGLHFGFGYPDDAIAVALANHGPSMAYVFDDAMWQKYRIGEFFKITGAAGAAVASNIYYPAKSTYDPTASPDDEHGMYQDTSLEMLQRRGVIVLACHTATEEQARKLVANGFAPTGAAPADVADDLLMHLIPGAIVVPSMVATIAVLQATYAYTYLNVTF